MATADIRIIESTISEKYILGMASVSYRFNTGHKITPAPLSSKTIYNLTTPHITQENGKLPLSLRSITHARQVHATVPSA
jgi:hypothetical protein